MEIIYHNNSNKSGVYKIFNKLNGRIYIGSTCLFKKRVYDYETDLPNGKCHNKFLQSDFNKCGTDAFIFEVLEVTDTSDRYIIEQKYLDVYYDNQIQCYNFKSNALQQERSCNSNTPEETAKTKSDKMKEYWASMSDEERAIKKQNHLNGVQSESNRNKISRTMIDKQIKRDFSIDHRQQLSAAAKKQWLRQKVNQNNV